MTSCKSQACGASGGLAPGTGGRCVISRAGWALNAAKTVACSGPIEIRAQAGLPSARRTDTQMRLAAEPDLTAFVAPFCDGALDHYELILSDIPSEIALAANPVVLSRGNRALLPWARTHSRAASGRAPATRELRTWERC